MILSLFAAEVIPVTPLIAASTWVSITARISMTLLVVALGLALIRLALGPTFPDRVVALDLVATLLVGLVAVSAVETGDAIFLRVAMVVALFNFIGTIGFCWYLQRGPDK